jgi:hypothetical protein
MRNLFDLIYEYQLLRGKQDHLEVPLDESERARLVGLAQMLLGDGGGARHSESGNRGMPRVPVPTHVEFTQPGGFESGEIKNASGSGLAIATRRPPIEGTRIVVRVEDSAHAVEYFFPCRVIWRRTTDHVAKPGMGLVFDGVPTRTSLFADEDTGVWQRRLRLGDGRRDVQAA